MITAQNIQFSYPAQDGGGFSLHLGALAVSRGEAVAVIGPSGSGKTTLLSLLAGIETPQSGKILVDGVEVSAQTEPERRAFRLARIGQVFQRVELLEYLTVAENILLPLRLVGRAVDATARDRAGALLARVGLSDKARRLPGTLSQGERQRVGICRALVARPPVVLADEPTSSLDGAAAGPVLDLFFSLVREEGATLVCLTHDTSLLPRFDRVVAMSDLTGRARGAPETTPEIKRPSSL